MEHVPTFFEGEWNSFYGAYPNEEADFMSQMLHNVSYPNESPNASFFELPSTFWPQNETIHEADEASLCSSDNKNTNIPRSYSIRFPTSSGESYFSSAYSTGIKKSNSVGSFLSNNTQMEGEEGPPEDKDSSPCSRKRSCRLLDVQEGRGNTKFRKTQKLAQKCTKDDSVWGNTMNNDSNAKEPASTPKSNGKKRASGRSTDDPQSVYAKKRREKINGRLRILQNLIPNGTKVDISTMLEEAVQYVKFLQLQIKLLSSDDLWMYAPIAYNGIDILENPAFTKMMQVQ